ncbi:hypothetical protein [Flavobacterium defluvii]|uniref:hypothetical protein n=1 Tax=Flavobacterium defluvii TaxID=370979 RepID=UPI001FC9764C|nr:hypothetical protein [Flavobacterium defluvii]
MKEDEPHALTVWALGIGEGFFVSVFTDIILIRFFCIKMDKWLMIGIGILFLLFNYFYFFRSERGKRIVISKSTFLESNKISIIATILFFLILISSLFWGAICSKYLLETYCNQSSLFQ